MLFLCLAFRTLGKITGMKHTVLPDGQPSTVAFTVLAQLCGPKADDKDRCPPPPHSPKMARGGTLALINVKIYTYKEQYKSSDLNLEINNVQVQKNGEILCPDLPSN